MYKGYTMTCIPICIGKDPDAGEDWRQEEKGTTEDEMVGWHHRLNGRELSTLWEIVEDREGWHAAVRYNWATEQQEQYMLLNFCFSPINPLSTGGRGGLSQEHRRVERKLLFLPYSGKVGRVWNVLLEEAKTRFCLKTEILGTSLALQWIRLCLPIQGV